MKTNPTILVVDDIPTNIRILERKLLKENYTIISANSGKAALEMVEKNKPDLILLDVMMPHMSGFEVCKILKSNPKTKSIPIIFLTARVRHPDLGEDIQFNRTILIL